MPELYSAILNPSGPNYERLRKVFDGSVPLESPHSHLAQLGEEKNVEVYRLNFRAMPLGQRAKLFAIVAASAGVPISIVEGIAAKDGFPIRAADVIVAISMRAFV